MSGAGPFVARRSTGWDLTPADVLRLVRNDAHSVALCGAWAGGWKWRASAFNTVSFASFQIASLAYDQCQM